MYRIALSFMLLVSCCCAVIAQPCSHEANAAEPTASAIAPVASAKDGLTRLLEGNKRFQEDHPVQQAHTLTRLRQLQHGQAPFAVVVSCSDSRVPPELIFDQGLGNIFIIRTAGHVIGDYEIGSIEYAVEHLHVPLVMVLGHQQCGAVSAFVHHHDEHAQEETGHIKDIVRYIEHEAEEQQYESLAHIPLDLAIEANVKHGVHLLKASKPILSDMVAAHQLTVVGAVFSLDDGSVKLIGQRP